MLQPKRTTYRKQFKGRIHGAAKGGTDLNFGAFGLKALEPNRVTAREIEAARRAITRQMKRQGRVWIRIFPDVPVTSKPTEVRMGKGKGAVDFWACRVKPGRVLFEVDDHNVAGAWTVIIRGIARSLRTTEEIEEAERAQVLPWTRSEKTHYVRIVPESVTGRRFRFGSPAG